MDLRNGGEATVQRASLEKDGLLLLLTSANIDRPPFCSRPYSLHLPRTFMLSCVKLWPTNTASHTLKPPHVPRLSQLPHPLGLGSAVNDPVVHTESLKNLLGGNEKCDKNHLHYDVVYTLEVPNLDFHQIPMTSKLYSIET